MHNGRWSQASSFHPQHAPKCLRDCQLLPDSTLSLTHSYSLSLFLFLLFLPSIPLPFFHSLMHHTRILFFACFFILTHTNSLRDVDIIHHGLTKEQHMKRKYKLQCKDITISYKCGGMATNASKIMDKMNGHK